jgi:excisionase family DNA binding protein
MTLQTPNEVAESPVFRFSEACAYLKVGETTLRGLVANGRLPIVRIGRGVRFTQWALNEYLRSAESGSTEQSPEVRDATGDGVKTERW